MRPKYYDPMFYMSSEEMPFNIRIEVGMADAVDKAALEKAVGITVKRYPYFLIRVKRKNESYHIYENPLPVVVYDDTETVYPLGSEELNGHMLAIGYNTNKIDIFVTHVMTDGGGFFPFIKSLLYYYISVRYGVSLKSDGINLVDTPFFDDELGNPFEKVVDNGSEPFYVKNYGNYFKLRDGEFVGEKDEPTVYRFSVNEKDMMAFSFDNDGSPCTLLSVLTAKAVWAAHPDVEKSLISAISFNLRPSLGNKHSHRLLSVSLPLEYKPKLKDEPVLKLCTCSRGMITLQSQPENVQFYTRIFRKNFENIDGIYNFEKKKEHLRKKALEDSTANTFSVSYVGRQDYGDMAPYIKSIYINTDGSTYKDLFVEVSLFNGRFYISLLQGFSSDVYYKELLHQFDICGIKYIADGKHPMRVPKTVLPK